MPAHDKLNPELFAAHLPPTGGAAPIPEGTLRFSHWTWGKENAESIRSQGLLHSKAQESYARGGTESPQTFATAGPTGEQELSAGSMGSDKHFIEGYARPEQLDIGAPWRGEDVQKHFEHLQARRSTITFHGDVPPEQITAVHEPWHSTARYLLQDSGQLHDYVHGESKDFTTGEPHADEALRRLREFYRK